MKIISSVFKDQQKEPSDLKLEDVDSFIRNMDAFLKNLQTKIDQLPKVDASGFSECFFAENLYSQKDEAAAKVAEESQKLKPYLELVKQQIKRCRHNIEVIDSGAGSLYLDHAIEGFEGSKQAQESELDIAIEQQELLTDLIKRTDKLLKLAREKNWPIGKPQEAVHFPILDVPTTRPSFDTEVNNLLSLGPPEKISF